MTDDQEGRTRGRNKQYLRVRTAIPLLSKYYRAEEPASKSTHLQVELRSADSKP